MKKAIVSPGIIEQFDQDIQDTNQVVSNVATVVTGNTNNSGHTISNGEYFIANGAKYKATATIGTGEAWATNAQSVSDHDLINALNSKIALKDVTDSFFNTVDSTYVESYFAKRSADIILVHLQLKSGALSQNTSVTIATVKSPYSNLFYGCSKSADWMGEDISVSARLQSGNINVRSALATTHIIVLDFVIPA